MNSETVANYFLKKSFDTGIPLTQMKLLKLVYIAHGWHCGFFGSNLIDDGVEAWKYGPVIPILYRQLKHHGRSTIDSLIRGFGIAGDESNPCPESLTIAVLDEVWRVYSGFTPLQLSNITHQPDTPWDTVWNKNGGSEHKGAIIPNKLIGEHYKQKLEQSKSNAQI